jgi:hypothetical protein
MEQASKGSFPHEGGLLLDPLHKKIIFSSVPMDREDRHQRVSAQVESVSGYKNFFLNSTSGFLPSGNAGTGKL